MSFVVAVDDASFYTENGLRVLNEWLIDGVRRKEPGMSKEKKRIEMFSQVRALLRVCSSFPTLVPHVALGRTLTLLGKLIDLCVW